jgi:hypothetical protein
MRELETLKNLILKQNYNLQTQPVKDLNEYLVTAIK